MKKLNLKNILAVSLLTGLTPTIWADIPIGQPVVQRNFVNLGFETVPSLTYANTSKSSKYCYNRDADNGDGTARNNYWERGHCLFAQQGVSGWKTTAAKKDGDGETINSREIEFWKAGGWAGITPAPIIGITNKHYAELNGHTEASLYQNVCISSEDTLTWSLMHAPRKDIKEKINFYIADRIVDNDQTEALSAPGTKYYLGENLAGTEVGKWKTHSGQVSFKNLINEFKNLGSGKTAAKVVSFNFEAVKTTGTVEEGNWLDNIVLNLNPGIEFAATSGSVVENQTGKYHSVDFNIVGNVQNDMVVKFIIDPNKVGNPAQYRKNDVGHYKIFALNKDGTVNREIIPTESTRADGKPILRFEYTIKYDSSLPYDTGVTVKGLAIQTFDNNVVDGNRTIPFELDPEQTGLAVMDLRSCGNTVFSGFKYEIQDDETDISVQKKLKNEFLIPNQEATYEIIVENIFNIENMSSTARNVTLKDTLLANLTKDATTEVKCEVIANNGVTATCPSMGSATQAATSLFSDQGLVIGDLPARGKLKFTVSKLKVSDKDTAKGDYQAFVTNQATVTTSSNDINLENNTSISKDLYPAKNDLMNADTTNTGKGLFVIDNNGEALWTKPIENQKAYFPLMIQNDSPVSQDYKLIASSTAITRLIQSDFSALDQATITSFTSGLNIKFYAVEAGKCKAGLSASDISQIQVSGNSSKQICAEITASESATASTDIWFAIESLQTGLGDIIKNKVTYTAQVLRLLELVNDQRAQVAVGGTYVFLHRLFNKGTQDENDVTFDITPFNSNDGFAYTLFFDKNNDGQLDAQDQIITSLDQKFSVAKSQLVQVLLKAQAPSTATNGMMSQVRLTAIPDNRNQTQVLESLVNTDTVYVGSDQVEVTKMQFKQSNCSAVTLSAQQIKAANYSLVSQTIGANDCLIYRITVKNIGSEKLTKVKVNDMYPAYTIPWKANLPMIAVSDSRDTLQDDGNKIEAIVHELLPQQEKSLYFGIKMQF